MTSTPTHHLFECFGIELEYMIVNRATLNVMPITDRLIERAFGRITSEIERGPLCWSNELVAHVVELKTNGPASSLETLSETFWQGIREVNGFLKDMGACLMPAGMHPWMDPIHETQIWAHEHSDVYESFHRIFGCEGHGWSNLQSLHINLPFSGDAEFGRLHSAIRLILPLLPGLAASSPYVEGRWTGHLDNRLKYYENNQRQIPSIAGQIIPESVQSEAQYRTDILGRIYRDVRESDPLRILQHEWLNSRGAIARFDRDAIEIRVMDTQECPRADLACAQFIVALLKKMVQMATLPPFPTGQLKEIYDKAVTLGGHADIEDAAYLQLFDLDSRPRSLQELLRHIKSDWLKEPALDHATLDVIIEQGPLAQRLITRLGASPTRQSLEDVYRQLCFCLEENRLFGT